MSDLISRQEALEELEDWERCYTWDEHCRESNEDYIVSPSKVIAKLPSAQPEKCEDCGNFNKTMSLIPQPEQRWIPCSEMLPSEADHINGMVLVCYRNGSVRFNTYMNGWVQGNPVAWMPLPKPYREERDGNT